VALVVLEVVTLLRGGLRTAVVFRYNCLKGQLRSRVLFVASSPSQLHTARIVLARVRPVVGMRSLIGVGRIKGLAWRRHHAA
jgi:hypothetical protein